MVRKMRIATIGACAILVLAVSAAGASAKGALDLKEAGATNPVKAGSTVAAGWYIGIGEKFFCQLLPLTEGEVIKEGSMVLQSNGASKDKAAGSVAAPACYEAEEETSSPMALHKRHGRGLRRHVFAASGTTITLTGTLSSQEVTTKHTGTIELSKPLTATLETAGLKCTYISKTKLKGTWPPEASPEFPNITKTADIDSEFSFKLDKSLSAKKGCAKSEEGFIETWLGPLGEELEAELVA